jgi:deoxycytidylate deaminase
MSHCGDIYLSLCLEQANKSSLHFRHGCIIVRGGKVIGQGYNTYRPGFDGGALKHGNHVGRMSRNDISMDESKKRFQQKAEQKPKSKLDNEEQSSRTFTPFEGPSGNYHVNMPLSMHSEMMAIQSALSLSSGTLSSQKSARATKWLQKPCYRPPTASKRKTRLRGLKAYVQAVCAESVAEAGTGRPTGGKFSIQESRFGSGSSQLNQEGVQGRQQGAQREGCIEEEWEEVNEGVPESV